MAKPTVYEIIWKYPNRSGGITTLKVCDYLECSFPWLYREEVVSRDKLKVEKTATYLKIIAPDDYEFIVTEKKYDECI